MYPEVRAAPFELDSEFCTSKYTLVQGPRAPLELTRNSSKGTIELTSFPEAGEWGSSYVADLVAFSSNPERYVQSSLLDVPTPTFYVPFF